MRIGFVVVAALLLPGGVALAQDEDEETSDIDVYVADQVTHDNNLYRLPGGEEAGFPAESRDDIINSATLGVRARWLGSRQALVLSALAADNRFQENSRLNNASGNASAQWDWRVGHRLTGQLGGDYSRGLAGFANNRFLEKDLVEHTGAFAEAGVNIGTHWRLKAGGRRNESEHSAPERRFDSAEITSGTAGLEYASSLDHKFELNYRYTDGHYGRELVLNGTPYDRNYDENALGLRIHYVLSPKTLLEGGAGYLKREYPGAALIDISKGEFSGITWDASLQWAPGEKTAVTVSGWRRLRAHLDAESDYFVAEGGSLAVRWSPLAKFGISLEATQEHQDYLGASLSFGVPGPRHDSSRSGEIAFRYSFLQRLELTLSGRAERRTSDRSEFRYDDNVAMLSLQWTLM